MCVCVCVCVRARVCVRSFVSCFAAVLLDMTLESGKRKKNLHSPRCCTGLSMQSAVYVKMSFHRINLEILAVALTTKAGTANGNSQLTHCAVLREAIY